MAAPPEFLYVLNSSTFIDSCLFSFLPQSYVFFPVPTSLLCFFSRAEQPMASEFQDVRNYYPEIMHPQEDCEDKHHGGDGMVRTQFS